jgi:hypothetical protein
MSIGWPKPFQSPSKSFILDGVVLHGLSIEADEARKLKWLLNVLQQTGTASMFRNVFLELQNM